MMWIEIKVQLFKIYDFVGKKVLVASHFLAGSIFSLAWLDPHSAYKKNPRKSPYCLFLSSRNICWPKKTFKMLQIFFSLVPIFSLARSDPNPLQIFFHACSIFSLVKSDHQFPRCKSISRWFHLLASKTCLFPITY